MSNLRRIHAIGKDLGLDHDALRDLARTRWPQLVSLGELTTGQCIDLYRSLEKRLPEDQRPRRQAPRGKVRPEGVTAMASPKQRWRIRVWLDQLLAQQGMTLPMVLAIARQAVGDQLLIDGAPVSTQQIADGVTTDADARVMIKTLFGELRRRGLWN